MLPPGVHLIDCVGGVPGFPCQGIETEWVYARTVDGTTWRVPMENAKWIENVVAGTVTKMMPDLFPLECTMGDDGMLSFDDSAMDTPWYQSALIA